MKSNNNLVILFLDIFFVLFLCFALLMFTMLLNKGEKMQVAGVYIIDPLMLGFVIVSVSTYLYLMTGISMKELSSILSSKIVLLSSKRGAEENGVE